MFTNYLKIAYRNLLKYKTYSLINIFGLAIGITSTVLIFLFVADELSYDKFIDNHDRIYRLTREWLNDDGETNLHLARCAPPIATLLEQDYPHFIEEITRARIDYNTVIKIDDRTFIEDGMFWADDNFFKIFSYNFIAGNPETALKEIRSVVLSKRIAEKYFGTTDVVGKSINYEDQGDLQITGVIENPPENTHLKFDMLGSMQTLVEVFGQDHFRINWGSNNYFTYILFPENVNPNDLKKQFPTFIDKHLTAAYKEYTGEVPDRPFSETNLLHLQKLTDIHLHSHLVTEAEKNGSYTNVIIFTAIALAILLIACINFMNLATARSAKRAKEIGMRKVLGAFRKQLLIQFFGESILISIIATAVSIFMIEMALPAFNEFSGKNLALGVIENPLMILSIVGLALLVGILSGSYPALFLSGFKPVKVLKGNSNISTGSASLRKGLVVVQFTVSVALIICVTVVYNQMEYFRNKDLGFDKDHIIHMSANNKMIENQESVKNQLLVNPNVIAASFSLFVPSDALLNSYGGKRLDRGQPEPLGFRLAATDVDYDFFDTFGIDIVAGRKFSRDYATDDSLAFIINETAVKKFGWQSNEEAVGKPLEYGGTRGRIIGVAKDINFESLHNEIIPQVYLVTNNFNDLSIKVKPENLQATISFLEKFWNQWEHDFPFEYNFFDEEFDQLYKSEQKLGELFSVFSILAICVACLGLLGLTAFAAEQRTKEIGIRKTLGASVPGIVALFSKEFLLLIVIANIIAWPITYYAMNKWLSTFAYAIDLNVIPFLVSGFIALTIALVTVSYQAIKAAMVNPINSIRYE